MEQNTYCVIMAGGKGERFWPLSNERTPKPFLKLIGEKTMIQLTVERARRIVPAERIIIVIGASHLPIARSQLPELPGENFIVEPLGRDTAPCIGYTAVILRERDPLATMVVLPADHFVPDWDEFAKTIRCGIHFAAQGDYFVTIGILPTRPETGYGYIRATEVFGSWEGMECLRAERFVEKPDYGRAVQYLADGGYFWNGGIFIWRLSTVLRGMEIYMPGLWRALAAIGEARAAGDARRTDEIFPGIEAVSIDYGLMEKVENVLVVPSGFQWDDVGTWASLPRVISPDPAGNLRVGGTYCIDTTDSVIYGDGIPVATLGISGLVVVAGREGVLVAGKERAQDVREIAKLVGKKR